MTEPVTLGSGIRSVRRECSAKTLKRIEKYIDEACLVTPESKVETIMMSRSVRNYR